MIFHPQFSHVHTWGIKIATAFSALAYRKALRLSKVTADDSITGKAISLLSSDIEKFEMVLYSVHCVWAGVLFSIVSGIIMFFHVGYAGVVGLAIIWIFVPIQSNTNTMEASD